MLTKAGLTEWVQVWSLIPPTLRFNRSFKRSRPREPGLIKMAVEEGYTVKRKRRLEVSQKNEIGQKRWKRKDTLPGSVECLQRGGPSCDME